MKQKNRVGIVAILIILLLTGCGNRQVGMNHKPRIFGATYMNMNNAFFEVINETLEYAIEGNGDILITRDPCQQQDKQNEQIMEMIEEGIEVLFLNPVDWETVLPALEACQKAGVVVINIDTKVKNEEYITSYIETDNYLAGVLCAEAMMKKQSKANIVIIDNPVQTSVNNRVQGFMDTIKNKPEYQVVYTLSGKGEFEVAAQEMLTFLDRHIVFDTVFGGNDPVALGALAALQQKGREGEISIYGIDGSPDFKTMISLGNVTGTCAQSPKTIAQTAAETAYAYLSGEPISSYIKITPYMITNDNLYNYEMDGWQ